MEAQLDEGVSKGEVTRRLKQLAKEIEYMHNKRRTNEKLSWKVRLRQLEKVGVNLEDAIKCFSNLAQ